MKRMGSSNAQVRQESETLLTRAFKEEAIETQAFPAEVREWHEKHKAEKHDN